MTGGCASVQCGYFLKLRCFAGQLCAFFTSFSSQPTFDESFNLMLLRLHVFSFAISLAFKSVLFFPHANSQPVWWRPKMVSRFIGELFCFQRQSKNISQQQLLQQLTGLVFATAYAHPSVKVCCDLVVQSFWKMCNYSLWAWICDCLILARL